MPLDIARTCRAADRCGTTAEDPEDGALEGEMSRFSAIRETVVTTMVRTGTTRERIANCILAVASVTRTLRREDANSDELPFQQLKFSPLLVEIQF
jgi:hypothetical protein